MINGSIMTDIATEKYHRHYAMTGSFLMVFLL